MRLLLSIVGLCCLSFSACKVEKTPADAAMSSVKTLGWDGDERACRIFSRPDGTLLLFASSNSFGNGLYDPVVCVLDRHFNITSRKVYGGLGSEILKGVHAMKDGRYVAWGTRQNSDGPDTDIYILVCDENGGLLWEKSIAPGPGAYDDIPVGVAEADDGAIIVACRSASNGYSIPGIPHMQSVFAKIDLQGNIIWILQNEANSASNVCSGILSAGNNEYLVLIRKLSLVPGEKTQVARLRDISPGRDTPALVDFKDLNTPGLHPESGVFFKGPDGNNWYFSEYEIDKQPVLLRIGTDGTTLSAATVAGEGSAQVSFAAVHDNRCWLLTEQRKNRLSANATMGIYPVAGDGINIQKPYVYGSSFRNVPNDLIPMPNGKLLLLGTLQSPNNAGSDILLLTLQTDGKL